MKSNGSTMECGVLASVLSWRQSTTTLTTNPPKPNYPHPLHTQSMSQPTVNLKITLKKEYSENSEWPNHPRFKLVLKLK
jgi:hypothetical protein